MKMNGPLGIKAIKTPPISYPGEFRTVFPENAQCEIVKEVFPVRTIATLAVLLTNTQKSMKDGTERLSNATIEFPKLDTINQKEPTSCERVSPVWLEIKIAEAASEVQNVKFTFVTLIRSLSVATAPAALDPDGGGGL
jgi:hypothetical protein